jgi:hypothetical protein
MESVANESEGVRKKLEKISPGAPVPEELRLSKFRYEGRREDSPLKAAL